MQNNITLEDFKKIFNEQTKALAESLGNSKQEVKFLDLKTASDHFIAILESMNRSPDTIAFYKYKMKFTIDYLRKQDVLLTHQITDVVLIDYINYLKSINFSNRTINMNLGAIKYLINLLSKFELISPQSFKVEKVKEIKPNIQPISQATLATVFKYLSSRKPIQIICFSLFCETGIRRTELIRLKTKNVLSDRIYVEVTKTNNPRFIFPSEPTMVMIKEYLARFKSKPEYLFTDDKTLLPLTRSFIDGFFRRLKKDLSIDILSPHRIRHSFGTVLAANGADIQSIKTLLGHSDVAMTLRYINHSSSHVKRISQAMNPHALINS